MLYRHYPSECVSMENMAGVCLYKQKDSFHLLGEKNLLDCRSVFSLLSFQAALIGKEFCGGFLSSPDVPTLPISGVAVVATK